MTTQVFLIFRTDRKPCWRSTFLQCALLLSPCVTEASIHQSPDSTTFGAKTETRLIRPGHSIGELRIGDTSERALQLLGKPTDDDLYEAPCAPRRIHWYDFTNSKNGVFVYLKDARIFQLKVESPMYASSEGITSDSLLKDVRRYYPQSRAYQLKGSGSKVNGGRDLIYWVDNEKGIAFELRYSYKTRKRLVSYIFVYEPGSNFQPEGCVSAPQQWHELKPFTSEVFGNQVRKRRGK